MSDGPLGSSMMVKWNAATKVLGGVYLGEIEKSAQHGPHKN
jgi:hypothetical protein